MLNETEAATMIIGALKLAEYGSLVEGIRSIRDFEEAGVMSRNAGFVLRMDDGSEFQVSVVRSR